MVNYVVKCKSHKYILKYMHVVCCRVAITLKLEWSC